MAQSRCRKWRHLNRGAAWRACEWRIPRIPPRSGWQQTGRGCSTGYLTFELKRTALLGRSSHRLWADLRPRARFWKAESIKRGFPLVGFSDSRCWLGLGASIDGETLFERSSGSCGGLGSGRSLVSCDGGDFRGKRGQRGEVVAALAGDRQRGGKADGRLAATAAEERAGVALGADRREAGPDVAGDGSRTGRARHAGELRRGVALLQARRDHVQKKPARQRAGSRRHRAAPRPVEAAPGPA